MASTALFNLERRNRAGQLFFDLERDIIPFVDDHWRDICPQRERMAQLLRRIAVVSHCGAQGR